MQSRFERRLESVQHILAETGKYNLINHYVGGKKFHDGMDRDPGGISDRISVDAAAYRRESDALHSIGNG
ncbi:MAG: hypothetical protein QOG73_2997, partial [Acetobacteraceae bacterium]|nr:hypothetical protein [Acetobacteraceae bacterium]